MHPVKKVTAAGNFSGAGGVQGSWDDSGEAEEAPTSGCYGPSMANTAANNVRIKLADLKDPLSKDELYVRTERPKGILRWEIETPASATGEKVRIVEYAFTLDFDRNFALRIPGAAGQAAAAPAQEKANRSSRSSSGHG